MNIVSFDDINKNLVKRHTLYNYQDKHNKDEIDIVIIDISTIFDFEEYKSSCKRNFTSIAIIDDQNDFNAFKNFGITAWINREDLNQLNDLLEEIESDMKIA